MAHQGIISKKDLAKIAKLIDKHNKFVITSHVNPDGDALGSEVALKSYLKNRRKKVKIINTSPLPSQYRFLDKKDIETYDPKKHDRFINSSDVVFVLDVNTLGRIVKMEDVITRSVAKKACIDHHVAEEKFTNFNIINPGASSTCEILYELFTYLNAKFTPRISNALYTGLLTDTASFKYGPTTPNVHRIASFLVSQGVKPDETYQYIYEQASPGSLKLLGIALSNMSFGIGGKMAWTYLTDKDFEKTDTQRSDTEGFVNYTLSMKQSKLGVFIYETEEGHTKVSLRSKFNSVNVNEFARKFGGGGHVRASGITLKKSSFLPNKNKIVRALKEHFKNI